MNGMAIVQDWIDVSKKSEIACDYFVLTNGKRYKLNVMAVVELGFVKEVDLTDAESVKNLVIDEVMSNQALYNCNSYLTQVLVSQTFASQMRTLESFLFLVKKNGDINNPPMLELRASEWLLFSRASAFVTDSILGKKALVGGVDKHAFDILESVHGSFIQGVKCVVKENDVPWLSWCADKPC